MRFLSLLIAFLAGSWGLYLGFRAFKNFSRMTKDEFPLKKIILNSLTAGSSGVLVFFALIMIMGSLDKTYIWNIDKFYGAIVLSFVPGVIITVGSFIQSIMIVGYKRILNETLRHKDK